jgi:hypothetical protein
VPPVALGVGFEIFKPERAGIRKPSPSTSPAALSTRDVAHSTPGLDFPPDTWRSLAPSVIMAVRAPNCCLFEPCMTLEDLQTSKNQQ